jgi:hypothetical protein
MSSFKKIDLRFGTLRQAGVYLTDAQKTPYLPVPVVYMAQDVMILMRTTSITRAIGRGGPNLEQFRNQQRYEKCVR